MTTISWETGAASRSISTAACADPVKISAEVYIYNAYTSLEIPVTVQLGDGVRRRGMRTTVICSAAAQIMKYYEDFRLRKIGTGTWLAETGKLVERMVTMDETGCVGETVSGTTSDYRRDATMKPAGSWIMQRICWRHRKLPAEICGHIICI